MLDFSRGYLRPVIAIVMRQVLGGGVAENLFWYSGLSCFEFMDRMLV
jgi:hypothetical protein